MGQENRVGAGHANTWLPGQTRVRRRFRWGPDTERKGVLIRTKLTASTIRSQFRAGTDGDLWSGRDDLNGRLAAPKGSAWLPIALWLTNRCQCFQQRWGTCFSPQRRPKGQPIEFWHSSVAVSCPIGYPSGATRRLLTT